MNDMEISYRNDANHNYLVIRKNAEISGGSSREKMIMRNCIPGLLRMNLHHIDDEVFYYYEIQSRLNLPQMFEGREIGMRELTKLFTGVARLFSGLENYLLSPSSVIFSPECIWVDTDTCEPEFVFSPSAQAGSESMQMQFMELAQFLIDKVDKEDRECTAMAYDYFSMVDRKIYSPAGIIRNISGPENKPDKEREVTHIRIPEKSAEQEEIAYWKDDDEDFEGTDFEAGTNEKLLKKRIKISLACLGIILLAGAVYLVLVLNPAILASYKITSVEYMAIGSVIAVLFAVVLVVTIYTCNKRIEHEREEADEKKEINMARVEKDPVNEKEMRCSFREEYNEQEEQTVLLTSGKYGRQNASLTGSIDGKTLKFEIDRNPFVIGKKADRVNGLIKDSSISRIHASIREKDGRYFVSDMNSTNGTAVNGRRLEINETTALEDGDTVSFANVMMTFRNRRQYQASSAF